MSLTIRPITLAVAKEFVASYHRHNIPPVGGKFAILCLTGQPVGLSGLESAKEKWLKILEEKEKENDQI